MSKPFYEDYVNHAMRFFARNPAINMRKPGLKNTDIQNWTVCNDVLNTFPAPEQTIILSVYKSKCSMPDSVRSIAGQLGMSEDSVWKILNRFSREFAKRRGLI